MKARGRFWAAFSAGVGATLLFGGPLLGAAWALTEPKREIGADSKREAAYRIYEHIVVRSYRTYEYPEPTAGDISKCEEDKRTQSSVARRDVSEAAINLDFAIQRYAQYLSRAVAESAKESALAREPTWFLGGLEGCINSSLFSYFCEAYVNRVGESSQRDQVFRKKMRESQRDVNGIWCLLSQHLQVPTIVLNTPARPNSEQNVP